MYDLSEELMKKRCVALVTALVGRAHSDNWWYRHNKHFNNTPQQVWKTDPAKVYKYLMGSVDTYS
jgi:hypothetical protein